MIYKLLEAVEGRWRRLNGYHLVPLVRAETRFVNGELVGRKKRGEGCRVIGIRYTTFDNISYGTNHLYTAPLTAFILLPVTGGADLARPYSQRKLRFTEGKGVSRVRGKNVFRRYAYQTRRDSRAYSL